MASYYVEYRNLNGENRHIMKKTFTSGNSARKEVINRKIRSAILYVETEHKLTVVGQIIRFKGTYLWHPIGKPKFRYSKERFVCRDGSIGGYAQFEHGKIINKPK